jgi:hypothetical protein
MTLARVAGVFYLVTFVAGAYALTARSVPANLVATASYIVVTVLFYPLFKPVSNSLSLLAAGTGLAGLLFGALAMFRLAPLALHPLVFFGFYCLLIGYLIVKSTFMPRWVGALLMVGGVGWLTFASPTLVQQLGPYNFAPGIAAEGLLTFWLLVFGVDTERRSQLLSTKRQPDAPARAM